MSDSYWASVGQEHHIDLAEMKRLAFRLLCMFQASRGLMHNFESKEAEADEQGGLLTTADDPLIELHDELIASEASMAMLQLAMTLRIYDDQMKHGPHADAFLEHLGKLDGRRFIGARDDKEQFDYRDACNSIIHALKIHPLQEMF